MSLAGSGSSKHSMNPSMATSCFPLHLPLPLLPAGIFHRRLYSQSKSTHLSPFQTSRKTLSPAASSGSPPSSWWEIEEKRWLREEQRWLREEQRWLREESRWASERNALLNEIAALRARIAAFEIAGGGGLPAPTVQLPPPPAAAQLPPAAALVEAAEVKKVVFEEKGKKRRRTLKRGSEGDDVKEMQEALQRLGFYSGEEDMEFSSFSSGTERAVQTWQASLGTMEDGIMTVELLERLLMEREIPKASSNEKDSVNGTIVASVTEVAEIQQTVIKESNGSEVELSQQKVFLIGENRWEDPSRLRDRDKSASRSKTSFKCLSCRGEGRLMCTECDGSGEPNIEPQFLEWFDEGMKCPYCEGLGYTICDVCKGKTVVDTKS